jgi:uncharacterized membrane protein
VIAVFVALSLLTLIGLVALSVDGGMLYLDLRDSRATADAAAMVAACDLVKNYPTNNGKDPDGTAKQAALDAALTNGYANDGVRTKVDVSIPPISGPYAGLDGYCEVIVTCGSSIDVRTSEESGGANFPRPRVIAK